MQYAVVIDGVVDNLIMAPEGFSIDGAELVALDEDARVRVGDVYQDGEFRAVETE
jgi:hypothetical protein